MTEGEISCYRDLKNASFDAGILHLATGGPENREFYEMICNGIIDNSMAALAADSEGLREYYANSCWGAMWAGAEMIPPPETTTETEQRDYYKAQLDSAMIVREMIKRARFIDE